MSYTTRGPGLGWSSSEKVMARLVIYYTTDRNLDHSTTGLSPAESATFASLAYYLNSQVFNHSVLMEVIVSLHAVLAAKGRIAGPKGWWPDACLSAYRECHRLLCG